MIYFLLIIFLSYNLEALQVNNLSILENLNPGSKKQIQLTLINDRDQEEQVDLKLTNYSSTSAGEHFFDDPQDESSRSYPRSCLNWIQLSQNRINLDPGETRTFFYEIEVPKNQTLNGSYWCVLLIEPAEINSTQDDAKGGLHLTVKIRYAHHIVVNLGNADPKLKIIKKEIKEINGNRYLCLHTLNEGALFFNPSLTLKLYNKEGLLENTLQSQSERLYPGNSQCYYLNLENVSAQKLEEKLTGFILFDGKNNIFIGDKFTFP